MAQDDYPKWTFIDVARWKLLPENRGGGWAYLRRFKDGWVKYNRLNIKSSAARYQIPSELLGCTAWIEVGGDPSVVDRIAYDVRSFDWSGPAWIDEHLTITKKPEMTSFGDVSIQLRTAAATMHLKLEKMSANERNDLIHKLETNAFNLDVVALHLRDLILHDFPGVDTRNLTQEQVQIAGARYNRGAGLSIESIRKNTSYGDVILKIWPRVKNLLTAGASGAW
jgi:hypothetical protein